jgi:hypothetical protein
MYIIFSTVENPRQTGEDDDRDKQLPSAARHTEGIEKEPLGARLQNAPSKTLWPNF